MVAILFSTSLGKATGSCSCKRTKFERASLARVIDEVASLVEEWGRGWVAGGYLEWYIYHGKNLCLLAGGSV